MFCKDFILLEIHDFSSSFRVAFVQKAPWPSKKPEIDALEIVMRHSGKMIGKLRAKFLGNNILDESHRRADDCLSGGVR
jgi:hypothetical protein